MEKDFPNEKWKTVKFDFEFSNDYKLEVSNFGRLKSHHKFAKGNILNGSMINGYKIIRLKFFTARTMEATNKFNYLQQQSLQLSRKIKSLKENQASKNEIDQATKLSEGLKKDISKKMKADVTQRTMHYQSLIHRLVADYFCNRPSEEHSVVAHLDYNKLNNLATNLKWMTPEENFAHQQKSPHVIAFRKEGGSNRANSKVNKLTVTKVMLLKKLLNQGKPIKTLVKQFKITDTQILRIKRGENWKDIEAAK